MQFWSYGPFPIEIPASDTKWKSRFWASVADSDEEGAIYTDLRDAIGCYVFVMERGEKIRPWYVGKTNAKTGFYGEIFTDHKLFHYKDIVENSPMGWKPKMLLFPLVTNEGWYSRAYKTDKPLIEWLERTLIGMALGKNPLLYNTRDTKRLRECVVDGVFGPFKANQRYDGAIAARKALTDHDDWDYE